MRSMPCYGWALFLIEGMYWGGKGGPQSGVLRGVISVQWIVSCFVGLKWNRRGCQKRFVFGLWTTVDRFASRMWLLLFNCCFRERICRVNGILLHLNF